MRSSLAAPTPLTVPRLGQGGRLLGGDLPQRRVVEDHVGRHALLLGGRGAPGAQPLEQRRRPQAGSSAAAVARPLRADRAERGRAVGVAAHQHRLLPAQHRGRWPR